jgi:uncharacterized protein (UPF0335 family)
MSDDIETLTDGELIDRIGLLSVEFKKLETRKKDMVTELLDRGFESGDGTYFHGTAVEAHVQFRIDREKLERDKGEAFLRPYMKHSTVSAQVRVTARADAAAARMAAE